MNCVVKITTSPFMKRSTVLFLVIEDIDAGAKNANECGMNIADLFGRHIKLRKNLPESGTGRAFEALKLGSTPRRAANNADVQGTAGSHKAGSPGSLPGSATMLAMLDGKEHSDCESEG